MNEATQSKPNPEGSQPRFCIRCGYDLSGLAPADACPECGLPEALRKSPDLLRDASGVYHVVLCRGSLMVRVGIAGYSLSAFLFVLGVMLEQKALTLSAGLVLVIAFFIVQLGWFDLAGREAERIAPARGEARRRTTLLLTTIAFTLGAIAFVGILFVGARPDPQPAFLVLALVPALVPTLIARHAIGFLWLARLAERIPDRALHDRMRLGSWLLPVVMLATCIGSIALNAAAARPGMYLYCSSFSAGLVLVFQALYVFSIMNDLVRGIRNPPGAVPSYNPYDTE